jgi:hypothetical protein
MLEKNLVKPAIFACIQVTAIQIVLISVAVQKDSCKYIRIVICN